MFATIEGIDGSGKSSVVHMLPALMRRDIVITREPTDSPAGHAVKDALARRAPPLETLFLFLADRAVHSEQIREWVGSGAAVVSDRFHDSTIAYQSAALARAHPSLDRDWLTSLARLFPAPDVTILLDVDPAECVRRIAPRGRKVEYEQAEFLAKVRDVYQWLAKREKRFVIVDASRPLETVARDVAGILAAR